MRTLITSVCVVLGFFILVACTGNQAEPLPEIPPIATAVSALPTTSPTTVPTATAVSNPPTSPPTPTPTATEVLYTPTPYPTDSPTFTPTVVTVTPTAAMFPVIDTAVAYVIALDGTEIRSGPSFDYSPIDAIFWAETIPVTGQSEDGEWWRVLCPDNAVGSCWVSSIYTRPIDTPTLEAMLPDPATLNSASITTVPSPDGRWQATATVSEYARVADSFTFFYTTLTVTDGTTSWTPIAEWHHLNGSLRPRIIQWSANGRYLYYTEVPTFEECVYLTNASNLVRLDVTDGTQLEILPENATKNLSMSPGGETLAYVTPDHSELMLRNMETGKVQRIPLIGPRNFAKTGEILWTADGETAVFTLIHDTCLSDNSTHSSIIRIDADTLTVSPVIDNDNRLLRILEWPDPAQNKVLVIDNEGKYWLLDIDSGELTAE